MYLALTLLFGLAVRRVCRLVTTDSIFDTWRTRLLARFPVNGAAGQDWRYWRWFPAALFAGEAEPPKLAGRLHGRRGYWLPVRPPAPGEAPDGGFVPPVLRWDETHEGELDRMNYPPRPEPWVARLVMCPWCLSVWLSAALHLWWRFTPEGRGTSWVYTVAGIAGTAWLAGIAAMIESRLEA